MNMETYLADKALPTPLASKGFDSAFMVPNRLLALLALGKSEPDMACLTVRMAFVNGEAFEVSITAQRKFTCKNWISTVSGPCIGVRT